MAMDISAFRQVSQTDGELRARGTGDQARPEVFGNSKLGKVARWINETFITFNFVRGPSVEANRQLKNEFIHALTQKYGSEFTRGVMDQVGLESLQPLSTRTVRDLIAQGDIHLQQQQETEPVTLPGTDNGVDVTLTHTRYETPEDVAEAADTLLSRTSLVRDGSGKPVFSLFHDLITYSNRPGENQALLLKVANREGGGPSSALLLAFAGNHSPQEYQDLVKDRFVDGERVKSRVIQNYNRLQQDDPDAYARYGANDRGPVVATANMAQISGRLELLSREFGEHAHNGDVEKMKKLGQEIVDSTRTQIENLERDIAMLSDPRLLEGLSEDEVTLVNDLRAHNENMLQEMRNPRGPYQQFIALGALAASDPDTAITRIQDLLGKMTGYVAKELRPEGWQWGDPPLPPPPPPSNQPPLQMRQDLPPPRPNT
jgi:hypothetical protein